MNANAWDHVIDDVAREMTAGAATPDFRARVMQQVAVTRRRQSRIAPVWVWRGAALTGAVAVVVLAVNVARPHRGSGPAGSPSTLSSAAPAAASINPIATAEPVIEASRARGAGRAPQMAAALGEWQQRKIPALADLAALELKGIQPVGLSMSQLGVTSLGIPPIVIAAIDDER